MLCRCTPSCDPQGDLVVDCVLVDRFFHDALGEIWEYICRRVKFLLYVPSWRQLVLDKQLVALDKFNAYLLWRRQCG